MTDDDKVSHPREDDRNDEVDGSPAPDPDDGETDAEDVPEAD